MLMFKTEKCEFLNFYVTVTSGADKQFSGGQIETGVVPSSACPLRTVPRVSIMHS